MVRKKNFIGIVALCGIVVLLSFYFVGCTEKTYGEFYSLEEAYAQGLISEDDLHNIFYHYSGIDKDGHLLPPKELDVEVLEKIHNDAKITQEDYRKYYKNSDFQVDYYGSYDGAVVIKLHGGYFPYEEFINIGGVWFDYWHAKRIKVWVEKEEN